MFCPICKAEYRFGFTKCSDCSVDLVEHLPENDTASGASAGEWNSGPPELLWSGDDLGVSAELAGALDASKIPHRDEEVEFGLLRQVSPPVYKIWIHPRDHVDGHAVLEDVLRDIEEQNQREEAEAASVKSVSSAQSSEADEPEESSGADSGYVPADFNPEDANTEVWSGDDADMAQSLKDCFREVGIGCVVEESQGKMHVRVVPSSEARAREVVREVVEGTPPE